MIANPRPELVARYAHEDAAGTYFTIRPIIAWDDNGEPLVVSDTSGRLMPARNVAGFAGVIEDPDPQLVAVVPAGGWQAEHTATDGTVAVTPLAAWGLRSDGTLVALDVDGIGHVEALEHPRHGPTGWRLLHPDAVDRP
jgi:hypothetical protein